MAENRKIRTELKFYLITGFLLAGISVYQMAHISGFVFYPDEFGYWANAAWWLGFDWSETVALQSFYSFGYSIVLLPLLKWISDPFVLYKAAIFLNVLFVYLHAVFLWKITVELESSEIREKDTVTNYRNKNRCYIIPKIFYCLMAVFYPALTFYMQVTLAESLLNVLFILSAYLFLKWDRTNKFYYAVFFLITLIYLYFVHMRAIGILLAGIICFIYSVIKRRNERKKETDNGRKIENSYGCGMSLKKSEDFRKLAIILVLLAVFILLFLLGDGIKEGLQSGIYNKSHKSLLDTNDYGGQIGKIEYLFSIRGVVDFCISCAGKLFYLGISTLGTFYFGIWHVIKKCRKSPGSLFLVLSALFTFLITAVYMIHGGRSDGYLYGRYNDFVVPVFIYFGLIEMERSKRLFRCLLAISGLHAAAAIFMLNILHGKNPVEYQGYFTVGLSGYLPREVMGRTEEYVLYPVIFGTIGMLLLGLVLGIFVRKKRIMVFYMLLFIGFYIYTGVSAGNKYIYDHSLDTEADMEMLEPVRKRLKEENKVVFYLSDKDANYLDIIQFCMREYTVHIVPEGGNHIDADYAITYSDYKQARTLKRRYGKVLSTYHFKLYYK